MKRKIRSYYNNDYVDKAQKFEEPSLTQQRYFAINDIKTLLAQNILRTGEAVYGEQSVATYEELMNEKVRIQREFSELPVQTQRKFMNASNYFKYVSDQRNYEFTEPEIIEDEVVQEVNDDQ